jgi:vacuolar-type H+-ATPase subunit E/Vma4
MLYQKAETKKNYLKRKNEIEIRLKNQFANSYNNFLNKSLASTLIDAKESILNIKNNLLSDLKQSLMLEIKELISNNYSNYLKFLNERIKKLVHKIDKSPKISVILNSIDYENIKKSPTKIGSLFENKVEIILSDEDFIGGFKVIIQEGKVNYDYSINALIDRSTIIIEKYLSNVFSEDKIQDLQHNFEKLIENKKLEMKERLNEYEQI